jgi:uncharacterized membrane protein YfcA
MYTSPVNVLLIVSAGAASGVLGAILGTGGGVFLIPALVLAFGVPMHYAVATSIVSVIATSSAVASANIERGTANMRLGMTLEIATCLGALLGGGVAGLLSAHALEGLFGLVVLPTAVLMWQGRISREAESRGVGKGHGPKNNLEAGDSDRALGPLGGRYYDEGERRMVAYRVRRPQAGLGVSFLAGSLSGLLGIGGGVFKVPALYLLCGVPVKAAAATSNFMIGVTAAASAFLYYGRGEVRPVLTAATVLGVLIGSAVGSLLNRYARGRHVRRLFAVLLVAAALQMLYRMCSPG